jgi:hypothetical protein
VQLAAEQLQQVRNEEVQMRMLPCMVGCCLLLLLLALLGKNSECCSDVYGVQAAPVFAAQRC